MASASKKLRNIMRKKTGSNPSAVPASELLGPLATAAPATELASSPRAHLARRYPLLKSASVSSMLGSHHLPSSAPPSATGSLLRSSRDVDDSQLQHQQQHFAFASFADELKHVRDSALALQGALLNCASTAAAADGVLFTIVAREKLGQLLLALRRLLTGYSVQHAEDILEVTGSLTAEVKGLDSDAQDRALHLSNAQRVLDKLVVKLSYSAMAFMYGDQRLPAGIEEDEDDQEPDDGGGGEDDNGVVEEDAAAAESYQTAARTNTDAVSPTAQLADLPPGMNTTAETDTGLLEVESAVDHALNRAKVWSQYAKSIITYVDKRNSLEGDFSRNLQKLAQSLQPTILENRFVPFQRAFTLAIAQDLEYCNMSSGASTVIQVQKFVEPLVQCRTEHDRQRRSIKEMWLKSLKRESDAVVNMKKARALYEQRWHEYEKAKDTAAKGLAMSATSSVSLAALPDVLSGGSASAAAQRNAEKKKRLEEEAWHRTLEAEIGYKAYVAEANTRHHELIKTKESVLQKVRDLLLSGDQTLKAATTSYFQLRRDLAMVMPVQLQMLFDVCSSYPPGAQYEEFASDLLQRHSSEQRTPREPYAFESYRPDSARGGVYRGMSGAGSALAPVDSRASLTIDEATSPRMASRSPVSDDSDSDSSSESSPLTSPRLHQRSEDMPTGDRARAKPVSGHLLRKLRTPSRCRLCDSYVYFGGEECEKCGLVCHRKCLRSSSSQCMVLSQQPPRRMTTFGVDVSEHVTAYNVEVPILVARCIQEIDQRGIQTKGIYRLSGVKSKVEKLCQSFENGRASEVDLSEHNPVVISNVLKLYLRQLPEPLLTNKLYPEFVGLMKEQLSGSLSEEQTAAKVCEVLQKLPKANYATLRMLVCHLRRVSLLVVENQMNANNLGIVFGPTIMQSSAYDVDDTAPLSALMDASHQARVVELLIKHAPAIFNYEEDQISQSSVVVDLSRASRDRYSLSSDGAESNLSFQENLLSNAVNLCLPEIDSSLVDEQDCNGNVFPPQGASSSDALSDVCTSTDRLSVSDGEYCEIAEGAFAPDRSGRPATSTAWPFERSASYPMSQEQQQLPKCNGATTEGAQGSEPAASTAAVMFTLAGSVRGVGSTSAAAAAAAPYGSPVATAAALGAAAAAGKSFPSLHDADPELDHSPIPPPRVRRSLARKPSHPEHGSPPSPMQAETRGHRRSMDAGAAAVLQCDSCPASPRAQHLSLLASSRDSLGASTGALDVDAPLPSIARSKSMSRIVFYSDFDTAGPSAAAGSGFPAAAITAANQARPAQRARSMKRMSDTPHFV